MADNQVEQKQAAQPKEGEKPKGPTGLEALVKEGSEVGNIALTAGAVGTSFAAGALYEHLSNSASSGIFSTSSLLRGLDAAVITASFPLGRIIVNTLAGKPTTAVNIRDEGLAGIIFTPAVIGGVKAIQAAPKYFGLEGVVTNILGYSIPAAPLLVAGLNFAVLTPALNALFYPLQYFFHNKKFEGMGEDFRKNYLRSLAWTLPANLFASGVLAASYYGIPFIAPYLFPLLALANLGYYVFASPDISYIKKIFAPVLAPYYLAKGAYNIASGTVSLIEKIGTSANRAYDFLYKFGRGIHDKILPKKVTAPAAVPAAQPA